ncbi:hypothetical protein [Phytohabitans kaempferiae]|uniref:Uncharacterized protein n=1 Tax=Phytohabitans kaempferiae TaxID=1620943 RepID=A0ABV6LXK6_9ACTN
MDGLVVDLLDVGLEYPASALALLYPHQTNGRYHAPGIDQSTVTVRLPPSWAQSTCPAIPAEPVAEGPLVRADDAQPGRGQVLK